MYKSSLKCFSLWLMLTTFAHAGIIIGGSRVIYEESKKEEAISVSNPDKNPYLIQSWVESEVSSAEKAPFIITPPLFRLDSGQENILRIVRAGGNLPDNKETLFWLNIKSIPSSASADKNTLQIAIRSRLKLIYRPTLLAKQVPEDVTSQLQWTHVAGKIKVTNPTAYYMSFMSVKVNGKVIKEANYVAPFSSATFAIPENVSANELTWQVVNDYGGSGEVHRASI